MGAFVWEDGYQAETLWPGLLLPAPHGEALVGDDELATSHVAHEARLLCDAEIDDTPTVEGDELRWHMRANGSLDLACSMESLRIWERREADLLAVRIVGHDEGRLGGHASHGPLPLIALTADDMRLREDGVWETPSIAWGGHVLLGSLWQSGNDGLWKESWHDLTSPSGKSYCFWDDFGSVPSHWGVEEAMPLMSKGLSKAMHYINLDAMRHSTRRRVSR